jgi:hypothetical protein
MPLLRLLESVLAQSGHCDMLNQSPLSGLKQTRIILHHELGFMNYAT